MKPGSDQLPAGRRQLQRRPWEEEQKRMQHVRLYMRRARLSAYRLRPRTQPYARCAVE